MLEMSTISINYANKLLLVYLMQITIIYTNTNRSKLV